ncbi:Uncharacterised protein [Chlamydia trachomatis]|nr:Uncharacterised protein [Chlamydia trachomatis]
MLLGNSGHLGDVGDVGGELYDEGVVVDFAYLRDNLSDALFGNSEGHTTILYVGAGYIELHSVDAWEVVHGRCDSDVVIDGGAINVGNDFGA